MSLATASSFADFVFERTVSQRIDGDSHALSHRQKFVGRRTEANMAQYRAVVAQVIRGANPVQKWKVLHEGRADDEDKSVFDCRFLTVNDEPLRCSPDLILLADDRAEPLYLIVERKTRTSSCRYPSVPDGTWPNVRAQLWCYSWITNWDWIPDSKVILMAEYYWCSSMNHQEVVYMGCRGVWRRDNMDLNQEAFRHFEEYGGKIDPRLKYQLEELNELKRRKKDVYDY